PDPRNCDPADSPDHVPGDTLSGAPQGLSPRVRHPPWRATMPHTEQWSRTRVRTCRDLRRGAWYRVMRATPAADVLEVNRRLVTVPRPFLQILPFRPQLWSVVPRVANAPQPPLSWGPSYGVCPQCSARASLGQHALKVSCPRCN